MFQNSPQGSVLSGTISYSKLYENSRKKPVYYQIYFIVPPTKVVCFTQLVCPVNQILRCNLKKSFSYTFWQIDEDKGKGSSPASTKKISERLMEEVCDHFFFSFSRKIFYHQFPDEFSPHMWGE